MASTDLQQDPVAKLIFEFSKLPGIGAKTATRLAYHVLKQDASFAEALAASLVAAKSEVRLCESCFTFTKTVRCSTCSDHARDSAVICVVEKPSDVLSIENSVTYRGLFHVLHGLLSPLDGIGPEDIKIHELLERIKNATRPVHEVILATNPSVEGEATAMYLARLIRPLGVKVTKLAHGIPVGGQLEYSDRQTIGKAIENRVEIH